MKGLRFTLVLRIFLLFMIILVVPLSVHTVIMYIHNYDAQRKEVFFSLNILADEEQETLEQFMRSLRREVILIDRVIKESNLSPNAALDMVVQSGVYTRAFVLSGRDGRCLASSAPDMVGNTYPQWINTGDDGYFLRATNQGLLFSQEIRKETINLILPDAAFREVLGKRHVTGLPYDSSLVDKEGKIVASSDSALVGKKPRIVKRHSGNYFYHRGEKRYAVDVTFQNANFTVLLDVPTSAAFFDFWDNFNRIILIFSIAVVLGAIVVTWIIFRMARPLAKLCRAMEKVRRGNHEARYKRDSWGFEINRVGEAFNEMITALIEQTERAEAERLQREKLSKELIMGGDMQKEIVPRTIAGFDELSITTGMTAAKEVGGDFYDLFPMGDKLLIVIADAAGKGVYAGFFALTLRGIIRGLASEGVPLAELIEKANALFMKDTGDTGVFITAWVGIYDPEKREIEYLSCGHPPAILRRADGTIMELQSEGMALGVGEITPVKPEKVILSTGDLLVSYTDGISEAQNLRGQFFGHDRLLEIVKKCRSAKGATEAVLEGVHAFEAGAARFDDQTVVSLSVE